MLYKRSASALPLILLGACGTDNAPASGSYEVTSDCASAAQRTGTLSLPSVSTSPENITVANATQFGFPSDTFVFVEGGQLTSTEGTRECKAQLFATGTRQFVFACRENGKVICTITMKQ
jgi:hypothetical protein